MSRVHRKTGCTMSVPTFGRARLCKLACVSVSLLTACAGATPAEVRQMGERGDTAALLTTWQEDEREAVRIEVVRGLVSHPSAPGG